MGTFGISQQKKKNYRGHRGKWSLLRLCHPLASIQQPNLGHIIEHFVPCSPSLRMTSLALAPIGGLDLWFGGAPQVPSPFGFERKQGSTPKTNPNHQLWIANQTHFLSGPAKNRQNVGPKWSSQKA